ncbi:MAG: hypothetical protein J6V44_03900 [Methanobrevibacter sp.]|nr:hypothetical protein [Methanobrevibacter sp.]
MGNDKIIIDLSKSLNARSFEETDIIHRAEFEKVIKLINNKITKVNDGNDNCIEIHKRYNDTITILGSRGSGKTSFLMSILYHCEKERNKDVEIIGLIDPTLIEEKGHIFLTLISLITDKVEKKISKNECDPYCKEYRKRKSWNDKLKKLAAGLPSIDIDNASLYSNWHDPEHVMRKGLESVKAAKELEENFNKIVEEALEILGKKAFLIAFDDIDVNFNNGWKVLETIRKYLTSQKIITLLSGDLKLFSKAIRKYQWKNLGNELLTWEGEKLKKIEKYDELVTEIESQYMQKIMKAPNRIHLLTIGEKLNNGGKIFINQQSNEITIYKHYEDFLSKLGLHNKYEIHTVNTYLLGLPLRTQIQILKQVSDSGLNILNVTDAFVSDLYESGVDVELAKSLPTDFCNIAHEFLLKKELLNETYQLLPTSGSVNSNAVLFSLYIMFVEHSKNNPSMFFEYWIAIATIKNLLTIMPYRSDQKKDAALVPTIEGLSDYSFIGQNKVYRDICSYLSTYIRASLNYNSSENKAPWGGTLILKGLAEYAKKRSSETQDRIDVVFKKPYATTMERQLAFFPMSIASYAYKQQSIVIYSFYTLLGTIVELLKRYNVLKMSNKDDETKSEKDKLEERIMDIHVLLNELSQIKDNVMPVFERGINPSEQEPIFNTIEEENEEKDTSLAKVLCTWMEKCPKCVPPHIIGKIATRAFYAMRTLDDRILASEEPNLGDAMHRRIIIVMNSALVEDAKENLSNSKLSNNNPMESNQIFNNNLNIVQELEDEEKRKLAFSRWIISCPLFLCYLNPDKVISEDSNQILRTTSELWLSLFYFINKSSKDINEDTRNTMNWCIINSIYEKLQQVCIFSSKSNKNNKKRKSNPIKFSFALSHFKRTINVFELLYDTPLIFLKENTDNTIIRVRTYFKEEELKTNIDILKTYCEGCSSWKEVIIKIKDSKKIWQQTQS